MIPPEGGIHFKTWNAMSEVNFFDHSANQNYDFSSLQVYINDELTNVPANSLTAEAGDDIRIVSRSKPYPFFYPREKDCIESIEEPLPFMGETDFSYYFYYCESLVSIPENLFINNPQITSFNSCFYFCKNLTSIPSGLFDNNPNATDFSDCFGYCTFIASIPEGLFNNNINATDFGGCFFGCTSLASIPEGLFNNNINVTDFGYCFGSCRVLTAIPQGLFDNNPNVTNFGYCFFNCIALTSISQDLFDNNIQVIDFCACFQNCTELKVNVQIGSTTNRSVIVYSFARNTAAKGTVYCRAGSNAYNAFLEDTSANVNVLTY